MTNVAKTMGTLLFISVGPGCGGGGSTATVSDFCTQLAVKECGTKGSGGVADRCAVDADTQCKPKRIALCMASTTEIQQTYGASRPFNPSRITDCLNKTAEVYAKATIVPADRAAVAAVCGRVFSGSKVKGDLCSSEFECSGDMICNAVCATKKTLAKGEFCASDPGAVCDTGLYCAKPAGQPLKMCVDRNNSGETCDDQTLCLETLTCVAAGSTCGPRAGLLEACTSDPVSEWDSDCAAAAPYCDPFLNGKCDLGFTPSLGTPECMNFGAAM